LIFAFFKITSNVIAMNLRSDWWKTTCSRVTSVQNVVCF